MASSFYSASLYYLKQVLILLPEGLQVRSLGLFVTERSFMNIPFISASVDCKNATIKLAILQYNWWTCEFRFEWQKMALTECFFGGRMKGTPFYKKSWEWHETILLKCWMFESNDSHLLFKISLLRKEACLPQLQRWKVTGLEMYPLNINWYEPLRI